jgi:hypothetical protein
VELNSGNKRLVPRRRAGKPRSLAHLAIAEECGLAEEEGRGNTNIAFHSLSAQGGVTLEARGCGWEFYFIDPPLFHQQQTTSEIYAQRPRPLLDFFPRIKTKPLRLCRQLQLLHHFYFIINREFKV